MSAKMLMLALVVLRLLAGPSMGEAEKKTHSVTLSEKVEAQESIERTVERGSEAWQFLAFVFAAVITIAFAFLDDLSGNRRMRAVVRVVLVLALGYLILFDRSVRNWLVGLLPAFKTEWHPIAIPQPRHPRHGTVRSGFHRDLRESSNGSSLLLLWRLMYPVRRPG